MTGQKLFFGLALCLLGLSHVFAAGENRVRGVAIFSEPGFPYSAMPDTVTPEYILDALLKSGITASFISARELSDPLVLNTQRYSALIMSYGETFPVANKTLSNIGKFVRGGGGIVCPAGVPLSHPVIFENNQWVDTGFNTKASQKVFNEILGITGIYRETKKLTRTVVTSPRFLPNLPLEWNFGGELGFFPRICSFEIEKGRMKDSTFHGTKIPFSINSNIPVTHTIAEDGEPALVSFYFLGHFPNNVILGFVGENHPWNPKTWQYAEKAIADFTRLAISAYINIEDVRTDLFSYHDGEKIEISVDIFGNQEVPGNLKIWVIGRDSHKIYFSHESIVTQQAYTHQTVTVSWEPETLPGQIFDVIARVSPNDISLYSQDTSMFFASSSLPAMADSSVDLKMRNGIPHVDGKPSWLNGVATFTGDLRGVGIFFSSFRPGGESYYHPLYDNLDMQIGMLKAMGANFIREGYYVGSIEPVTFQNEDSPALRGLDAFIMLGTKNRIIMDIGPTVGGQGTPFWENLRTKASQGPAVKEAQQNNSYYNYLYQDEDLVKAEDEFIFKFANRYRDYKNIAWELLNENHSYYPGDLFPPFKILKEKEVVDMAWLKRRVELVKKATGREDAFTFVQDTSVVATPAWDAQKVADIVSMQSKHTYRPFDVWTVSQLHEGFNINFGYPASLGEWAYGSSSSAYDRVLFTLIGENATGQLHFYLYGNTSNGTSVGRLDLTEGDVFKPFRQYHDVAWHIDKSLYEEPGVVLLHDHDSYIKDPENLLKSVETYLNFLKQGVYTRIYDLERLMDKGHCPVNAIVVPNWLSLSKEKLKLLQDFAVGNKAVVYSDMPGNTWNLPIFNATEYREKNLGVRFIKGEMDITYIRELKNGGKLLVLLNHSKTGKFQVGLGGKKFTFRIPTEWSGLLKVGPKGEILLIRSFGRFEVNDQVLVDGPAILPYTIASLDGQDISQSGEIDFYCEDQSKITLNNKSAAKIATLKEIRIYLLEDTKYQEIGQRLKEGLNKKGVDASLQKVSDINIIPTGNSIILGPNLVVQVKRLLDKKYWFPSLEGPEMKPSIHFGEEGSNRLIRIESGFIHWIKEGDKNLVLITGIDESGTALAVEKFLSLEYLGSYYTYPFFPIRRE